MTLHIQIVVKKQIISDSLTYIIMALNRLKSLFDSPRPQFATYVDSHKLHPITVSVLTRATVYILHTCGIFSH